MINFDPHCTLIILYTLDLYGSSNKDGVNLLSILIWSILIPSFHHIYLYIASSFLSTPSSTLLSSNIYASASHSINIVFSIPCLTYSSLLSPFKIGKWEALLLEPLGCIGLEFFAPSIILWDDLASILVMILDLTLPTNDHDRWASLGTSNIFINIF